MRSRVARDGVLAIGFGSPLRGDDAMGPVAARRLAERGFDAIAVHQLAPELAERIAQARAVVFLDADARLAPGEVALRRLSVPKATAAPLDHHASPAGLLRLARIAFGAAPDAWLASMGGAAFELGDGLSGPAEQAVERILERIARAEF